MDIQHLTLITLTELVYHQPREQAILETITTLIMAILEAGNTQPKI
jgi:hypothetical protein